MARLAARATHGAHTPGGRLLAPAGDVSKVGLDGWRLSQKRLDVSSGCGGFHAVRAKNERARAKMGARPETPPGEINN